MSPALWNFYCPCPQQQMNSMSSLPQMDKERALAHFLDPPLLHLGSSLPDPSWDQSGRSGRECSVGRLDGTLVITTGEERAPWSLVASKWILLWEYLFSFLTWSQTFVLLQILPSLIWLRWAWALKHWMRFIRSRDIMLYMVSKICLNVTFYERVLWTICGDRIYVIYLAVLVHTR